MHALWSVVSLGSDGLVVCAVLGTISLPWRERFWLACAFGAWDAWACLLGSMAPATVDVLPAFATAAIVYICLVPRRRWMHALAVVFSLDSLISGTPATLALAVGFSSATLAFVGFCLATALRNVQTFGNARQVQKLSGALR